MNPRIAALWLFAFIAVLIFALTWRVISNNRDRKAKKIFSNENWQYAKLVSEIYDIARDAASVDPSAQLIMMKIDDTLYKMEHTA